MKKALCILAITALIGTAAIAETVTYYGPDGPMEVKLHSGVQIGMGIREIVQCETEAGNELSNNHHIMITAENAETVELPDYCMIYQGSVAGGNENSVIYYYLKSEDRSLYCINYYIGSKDDERWKTYERLEASLTGIYGPPSLTAPNQELLYPSSMIVPYARDQNLLSMLAKSQYLTNYEDYTQRILLGNDGSILLIEHALNPHMLKGNYNIIQYSVYNASLFSDSDSTTGEDESL